MPKPPVLKESDTATSSGTFKNGGVVDAFKRKTSPLGSPGIASESDAMDIDKEAAEGDQSEVILLRLGVGNCTSI